VTGSRLLARALSITVKVDLPDCNPATFARHGVVIATGTLVDLSVREPRSWTLPAAVRQQLCVQEQLSPGAGTDVEGLRATSVLTITSTTGGTPG
jgi:hypothetical protein